ncbi:hypothetical protein JK162_05275 [Leuconostoc pseudomesenteroides]|uniref:hypothetical protein n=1 Tax=Leuconostoc pseudomesenteroides TaxID=33968 RepID=UPI001B8D5DE4|nr:hypothetical protein [Leuconostoc pseudomesenteroides]MBS0957913.1 hypothetical protein [Leuconostoc pseudomesenteroides]
MTNITFNLIIMITIFIVIMNSYFRKYYFTLFFAACIVFFIVKQFPSWTLLCNFFQSLTNYLDNTSKLQYFAKTTQNTPNLFYYLLTVVLFLGLLISYILEKNIYGIKKTHASRFILNTASLTKVDIFLWGVLVAITLSDIIAIYVFWGMINNPTFFNNINVRIWILSILALYLVATIGSITMEIIYFIKPKLFRHEKLKSHVVYAYIIMPLIITTLFSLCGTIIDSTHILNLFSALVGIYCMATIKDTCSLLGETLDKEQKNVPLKINPRVKYMRAKRSR